MLVAFVYLSLWTLVAAPAGLFGLGLAVYGWRVGRRSDRPAPQELAEPRDDLWAPDGWLDEPHHVADRGSAIDALDLDDPRHPDGLTAADIETARALKPYLEGYSEPMIDARRLRISTGTASEQDRRDIAAEDFVLRERRST
jgi:hypothetical protein